MGVAGPGGCQNGRDANGRGSANAQQDLKIIVSMLALALSDPPDTFTRGQESKHYDDS